MRGSTVIRIMLCAALLFSFALALPPSTADAGSVGWRWLNPQPTGDSLNAVSMSPTPGSSCMWAVGNYGFIAKTFDYGASWHQFTPAGMTGNPSLTDIDLVSDSVGWAVGANGTIVKISEGWQTAFQVAPAGTGHLYAVDAWSATVAYAAGADGVVIKTTDGGLTWSTLIEANEPGYSTWNAISALDGTRFWVAGEGNGGTTNNDIFFFDGTSFYNKSTGDVGFHAEDLAVEPATNTLWVVGSNDVPGSPKHYRVTNDPDISTSVGGGLSYAEAAPTPTVSGGLTSISRPDATHTWVTTQAGEVVLLDETALPLQWATQTHPYSNGTWLNDADFRVDAGQYRGVYVANYGIMGITANGGGTWTKRPSSKLYEDVMGLDFVSTTTGYVTQGANVAKTTNSGSSWTSLPAAGAGTLLDVDFQSTGKGWAVGRSGTAVFFGGTAWTSLDLGLPPGGDLYSVSYLDPANVWACGDAGGIYKFNSTTSTWAQQTSNAGTSTLRNVDFFDSGRGIAVGDGGTVVFTTNGGTTWTPGDSGVIENIYSVDMVSATVGFLVGDNAGAAMTMKKTTDGGATWTSMTPPAGLSWTDLSAVSFADANNGWIVGGGGTILRTTTGAATPASSVVWTKETMSSEWLTSISVVSPSAAWAGGYGGAILTNYTPPTPPAKPMTTVYRLNNLQTGAHIYTASADEKAYILKTWPTLFRYEGVAYQIDPAKATQSLWRFYNLKTNTHFYTASDAEMLKVKAQWPDTFRFEGEAYDVGTSPATGGAVWRFCNTKTGAHFFTASPTERDYVKATWPTLLRYEGEAFYTPQ